MGNGLMIHDYGLQVSANEAEARANLELVYGSGDVWSLTELREEFEVVEFWAPFVTVVRKSDNKHGTLEFTHNPRFYFHFIEAGNF